MPLLGLTRRRNAGGRHKITVTVICDCARHLEADETALSWGYGLHDGTIRGSENDAKSAVQQ
jgi:hypothetical protein